MQKFVNSVADDIGRLNLIDRHVSLFGIESMRVRPDEIGRIEYKIFLFRKLPARPFFHEFHQIGIPKLVGFRFGILQKDRIILFGVILLEGFIPEAL
jgi:hypothetical protein